MLSLTRTFAPLVLCGAFSAPARIAEEKPFPLETVTLKTDGQRFFVQGRMVVPHNAKVVSLRATTITGRGEDAVLVVSGELQMRAVTGGLVVLDNVRIELAPDCIEFSLMNCEARGSGGVISDEKGAHEGKVFVSSTKFLDKTRVALRMSGGTSAIGGCTFTQPLTIVGVPRTKDAPSQLEFGLQGCHGKDGGLNGGLRIEGVKEVNLAYNDFGGAECVFADCQKLKLYGNNVRAGRFELRQSKPGKFGGTDIEADDFRTKHIVLAAPAKKGAPERLAFTSCWFGGMEDEKLIKSEVIEDAAKDPSVGVSADLEKILAAPLGMGGDLK